MQKRIRNIKKEDLVNSMGYSQKTNNEFINKYKIKRINVRLFIYKQNKPTYKKNYVSGSFKPRNTNGELIKNEYLYNVGLDVDIYNWDFETNLSSQIQSVLAHEIHHGFDYIQHINSKSKIYTKIKNQYNNLYKELYKNYPQLTDFMNAFYYNLPEERNARIQQLYSDVEEFKNDEVDDIVNKANNLSVFDNFRTLRNFDRNEIDKIPKDIQQNFIKQFNNLLIKNKNILDSQKQNELNPKHNDNPKLFFDYWISQFQKNGQQSINKALKLISQLKYINENKDEYSILEELDGPTLMTVLGNYLSD